MKKVFFSLIILLQLISFQVVRVSANESSASSTPNTEVSLAEFKGNSVANQLLPDQFYQFIIKNDRDEIIYQKDDVIFSTEDLEKVKFMFNNYDHVYLDLGDGQYALDIAKLSLIGNQLTFVNDQVLGYQAIFHEGLVTESGLIFSDSTDPIIQVLDLEQADISHLIVEQPSNMVDDMIVVSLNDQLYWGTLPYKEGINGEEINETNTVLLGAFTLSSTAYNLHLNLVPKAETTIVNEPDSLARLAVASESQIENAESSMVMENDTNSLEKSESTETMVTTTNVIEQDATSTEVAVGESISANTSVVGQDASTTVSAINLPKTGEKTSFALWIGLALAVIGAILILLPKFRKK